MYYNKLSAWDFTFKWFECITALKYPDDLQKVLNPTSLKMTMWADNVKFVKDIVDSKYAKIETAAADVRMQILMGYQILISGNGLD